MRGLIRRALAAALLAVALPALSGCSLQQLRVVIPDFDTADVEGVRVWRLDDATGQAQPRGELAFQGTRVQQGEEWVDYTIVRPDGTAGLQLMAEVIRDAVDPDRVTLHLYYNPTDSQGWYKVSTWNAVGESPLSLEQTYLSL